MRNLVLLSRITNKILSKGKLVAILAILPTLVALTDTANAQLYGELDMSGTISGSATGKTGSFKVGRLINRGSPDYVSGTIEIAMWATRSRYAGGTISGTKLLKCRFAGLQGGYQYDQLSCSGRLTTPKKGSYFLTITVAEYDGENGAFYLEDYVNFPKKITVK